MYFASTSKGSMSKTTGRVKLYSKIAFTTPVVLILAASFAVLVFTATSAITYTIGFPLDDAWIHQTYARNLAQRGEWAFIPGVPSGGSTSPMWTFLVAFGHLNLITPHGWTYLVGLLSLLGLALFGERLFRSLAGHTNLALPAVGLFLALEWHLVWAAVSGMETLLYAVWIVFTFYLLSRTGPRWGWIGLLVGSSMWIRPDGVTLIGPALLVLIFVTQGLHARLTAGIHWTLGFLGGAVPYLIFIRIISGSWLPNTFYAKQAEYAIYQQIPLLERFLSLAVLPMIGAGVLLLPGFLYAVWTGIRKRDAILLSMILWWVGFTLLYALRLPVTYQHGRYLIPAMPVYFILGSLGIYWLFMRLNGHIRVQFVVTRSVLGAVVLVTLAFFVLGARQYGKDVAIIETEMVRTAKWVASETKQDTLIAAHDIGALGYFGNRQIIDLAGLISPEVIPFIRDEERLESYLDERKIDYLMTFPDWYPLLIKRGEPVYTTQGTFAIEAGGENMTVYRWLSNEQ
jgi:hypothetical protein